MEQINLMAPVNSLGYGQVGKNVLHSLANLCEVALFPIGRVGADDVKDYNSYKSGIGNAKSPNWDAPCIRIWHQHDMSQFVGNGPKIGFPIFELDKFTDQEIHHLNHADFLFVCSKWAKKIVCENTKHTEDTVHVVPLGVENYGIVSQSTPTTKFFTCGKWEIRKGHDVLIHAFNSAFEEKDDVELYMMCTNPFLTGKQDREWKNKYLNSPMGHKVRFIPRVQEHYQVIETMSLMDCGVFISRAEGWNLELLEMMSLGKSVITTDYSGHTEFCNDKNSMLVEIDDLEPAVDNIWFNGHGNWAKLGVRQIVETSDYMKSVHRLKTSGTDSALLNVEGIKTGKNYTWENTATEIINGISNFRNFSASS